jgi:hypothetical protein
MKKALLVLILSFCFCSIYSQSKSQLELLGKFIDTHNLGTEEAISVFVKESYEPSLYKKIDLTKHIDFYNHIIKEFGPLNKEIYKLVEVKPTKLVVQLIKEKHSILNQSIDPSEILMVELDFDENNIDYLSRGLGLGALVCSIRGK